MIELRQKLLVTILNHPQADAFVKIARDSGATGASLLIAKGTASNSLLALLGFQSSTRDIVLISATDEVAKKTIIAAKENGKFKGVCAIIGESMGENSWDMITCIVNAGFSDDIMDAARKNGCTGGTIAKARGTAKPEEHNNFFGITIVPEKEMIILLSKKDKTSSIVESIKKLDCLQKKGVGIIYTQPVEHFESLGK